MVKLQPSGELGRARGVEREHESAAMGQRFALSDSERIEEGADCSRRNDAHSETQRAGDFRIGQECVIVRGLSAFGRPVPSPLGLSSPNN